VKSHLNRRHSLARPSVLGKVQAQFSGAAQLIWIVAVVAALLLSHESSAAPVKPVRRVLVLYELGLSSPAVSSLDGQILAALQASPFQVELYREYLETTLFPKPATQQEFHRWYIHKYRDHRPDLIIALGPSPLKFLVDVHEKAFRDVPVVFGGTSEEQAGYPKLDGDYTGVWEQFEPDKTLEVALRLQPGTRHVVVVGGTSAYDRDMEGIFRKSLHRYERSLDFNYLVDLEMPALLDRLKHLPPNTIILYSNFERDAAGTPFIAASQSDPMFVAAANAPIYCPMDVDWGHGEVGGFVESFSEEGKLIGGMTQSVLYGKRPQDIPVVHGANTYLFDWRALHRWGLKESDLPAGSLVLNRQLTVWESYKWYIIGGASLMGAEALLILGLIWQRARRRAVETKLRESEQRFRLVANTAPVMIWMSGADKRCTYFNQPWLSFTGRTLETELGNGWADGVHPDDLESCLKTYNEAFDLRESFNMQYRLRQHDGEYRWVSDIGVPRFEPDGSFAGYIGSCIDVTDRKLAEEALATVGRRLIAAQEQERAWIARELHDDINQRLALLAADLERGGRKQNARGDEVEVPDFTRTRVSEIARDIQALSHRLHSSKLEYLGLATAAKSFCREFSEQHNVRVEFTHSEIPRNLPAEVSLALFRVLQEALQNGLKHSEVEDFKVDLRSVSGELCLTVSDAGKGFDTRRAMEGLGLGLISMRERLQLVRGDFFIKSELGRGTTVYARAPVSAVEERASITR
jgi:PAS domain S-box-containing protein